MVKEVSPSWPHPTWGVHAPPLFRRDYCAQNKLCVLQWVRGSTPEGACPFESLPYWFLIPKLEGSSLFSSMSPCFTHSGLSPALISVTHHFISSVCPQALYFLDAGRGMQASMLSLVSPLAQLVLWILVSAEDEARRGYPEVDQGTTHKIQIRYFKYNSAKWYL